MPSDEDLIIQIPDDEPTPDVVDAEFTVIDEKEDTPIDNHGPDCRCDPEEDPTCPTNDKGSIKGAGEQDQNTDKEPEATSDSPDVMSWPAIKMYHPMIGVNGTPEEIPEDHEIWLAANIMMGPAGSPLREGTANIFVSGKTAEDVAEYIKTTITTVLEQMRERMSPIQKASMADLANLPRMNPNQRR